MGDTSSLITVFLCIALLIFWRRYRSMHRPIKGSGKRILWPLLFLTPGIIWFFGPVHPAILQVIIAVFIGVLFAVPLIVLTNYERRDYGNIYTKKKCSFFNYFYCTCRFKVWLKKIYCGFRSTNGWFIILRSCSILYHSVENCLLYKV